MTLTEEVSTALAENRPVVALESTIITHGMPYPANLETAQAVEAEVRAAGAVPATLAVIDGDMRIGLDPATLENLAQAQDVMKLSRADLAWALATGATGATTVAATMICADRAGIATFATGGIGGVHRGAELSFDVSADLQELAQTPVTVVCAGAKAILDLPKTLEVLETLGVPVIGWQTDTLPAFWSRDSGLPVPLRVDNAAEIARGFFARKALNLPGGQLVVNPIPHSDEIPRAEITPIIEAALAAAEGIAAKEVTPFLLGQIVNMTDGQSLSSNIALVKNNARLAAEIATQKAALAQSRA
ncbi:MAG: pseudouridine-5'-phosphate glycosidase [Pseudomonadota bacterium]